MAITKLNSLAIPAGTVEPADISYPLTNFSSTGIDDNADATAITIDSSERIGVGTTNPSNKFVVAEATNQHGIELAPGTLSYIQAYDRATSDYGDLTIDAETIRFGTNNGSERMRIDSSGNVGIGTTSPSYKLEVVGQAQTDTLLVDTAGGVNSGFLGGRSDWTGGSTDNSFAIGSYQANVCFFTNNSGTERMRIDSSGNVGIGITSMVNPLHIGVTPNSTSKTSGSAFDGSALRLDGNLNGADKEVAILGGANDNLSAGIGFARQDSSTWGTQIRFYTHGTSVTTTDELTERMRIDANGYVTKPQTPVFSYGAYTTYDVTGTGTQIVSTSTVWNNSSYVHLNYNNGSHFNASNGRFTAPVAGIYRFDYRCGLADHNSGYFWWYIYKNSTAIAYWQSTQGMSSGSDDVALAALHVYVNLAANDYVEVKWANNYVSGTVYYPHFSGALVA